MNSVKNGQKLFKTNNSGKRLRQLLPIVVAVPFSLGLAQGYQSKNTTTASNPNQLTVVTVQGDSTLFENDGFKHGFAYDLVRSYAKNNHKQLNVVSVSSEETALNWVKKGKAQIALSTADIRQIEHAKLIAVEGSCGAQGTLQQFGLNTKLSWVFAEENTLTETASGFLCQAKQNGQIQQLASFYAQNYIKPQEMNLVTRDLKQRLPVYKANFQQTAKKHDLDWQFLAAVGYQESHLNPQSVSPTGVRGVMMLTASTAKAMGVSDRTNAQQSIQGGAKYLDLMLNEYSDIPYPDRNWFALVAYNMGPGAVRQIRTQLKRQGKDSTQWVNLYQHLNANKSKPRYAQAIQYVKRIRVYLEHIKSSELARI